MLCARPQPMEASANTPTPARKTRRLPNRSPSVPPTRINAPRNSPYDSTTHCTPTTVAPRLCCSAGNATLTTVLSMKAMLEARIVAVRIHGLDSSPQGCVVVAALTAISSHGVFTVVFSRYLWMRAVMNWVRNAEGSCKSERLSARPHVSRPTATAHSSHVFAENPHGTVQEQPCPIPRFKVPFGYLWALRNRCRIAETGGPMSKTVRSILSLLFSLALLSALTMAQANGNTGKTNQEHHSRMSKAAFWRHHNKTEKNAKQAQTTPASKQPRSKTAQLMPVSAKVSTGSKNQKQEQHAAKTSKPSAKKAAAASNTNTKTKAQS